MCEGNCRKRDCVLLNGKKMAGIFTDPAIFQFRDALYSSPQFHRASRIGFRLLPKSVRELRSFPQDKQAIPLLIFVRSSYHLLSYQSFLSETLYRIVPYTLKIINFQIEVGGNKNFSKNFIGYKILKKPEITHLFLFSNYTAIKCLLYT